MTNGFSLEKIQKLKSEGSSAIKISSGLDLKDRAVLRELMSQHRARHGIGQDGRRIPRSLNFLDTSGPVRLGSLLAVVMRSLKPILEEKAKANNVASAMKRNGKPTFQNSGKSVEPIEVRQELATVAGVSHDTITAARRIVGSN